MYFLKIQIEDVQEVHNLLLAFVYPSESEHNIFNDFCRKPLENGESKEDVCLIIKPLAKGNFENKIKGLSNL